MSRSAKLRAADEHVDVAVIGGGMAGLAAADELARRGYSVRLLEAAPAVGGLGRSVTVGGEQVEADDHHIFPQDRETRDLVDRLGLSQRPRVAVSAPPRRVQAGTVFPFDSPSTCCASDHFPSGAASDSASVRLVAFAMGRGRRLESMAVGKAGPRWFGAAGYDVLWRPLLDGKFGPFAPNVTLAWLVARMRQRAQASGAGVGNRLGYVQAASDSRQGVRRRRRQARRRYHLQRQGHLAETRWREVADRFGRRGGHLFGRGGLPERGGPRRACETAGPVHAPARSDSVPRRGLRASGAGSRPGPPLLGEPPRADQVLRLAVIEHTNFVPPERYSGRHIVYLTHYVEVGGPVWTAAVDEIVSAAEPSLRAINPAFDRTWILASHLTRDRWAQPVPLAGISIADLPVATGLPGLFHASLAHVYPNDRGVSPALSLGRRVAAEASAGLAVADDSTGAGR